MVYRICIGCVKEVYSKCMGRRSGEPSKAWHNSRRSCHVSSATAAASAEMYEGCAPYSGAANPERTQGIGGVNPPWLAKEVRRKPHPTLRVTLPKCRTFASLRNGIWGGESLASEAMEPCNIKSAYGCIRSIPIMSRIVQYRIGRVLRLLKGHPDPF